MDTKKTGELIAQCRKARGLSQGELASRLHVTDKAVSKWETPRSHLLTVLGLRPSVCASSRWVIFRSCRRRRIRAPIFG